MRKFRQISIKYRKKLWKWNSTVFPFKHAPLNFNDPLCFIIGIIRQNIGCIYISVENRIKLSETSERIKTNTYRGGEADHLDSHERNVYVYIHGTSSPKFIVHLSRGGRVKFSRGEKRKRAHERASQTLRQEACTGGPLVSLLSAL